MHHDLPHFVTDPNPDIYLGHNYLVVDLETQNHEFGSALDERNFIILAHWRVGPDHPDSKRGRDYSVWADEFGQSDLLAACALADFIVAHHAKFELGWFRRCGLDLRKVLTYDTMIGEKVLAGNRRWKLSLEACAARRGLGSKNATAGACIQAGVSPELIPTGLLGDYCAQDVALTEAVFLTQRNELSALGLLPVAYVRNLATPALADMEYAGMTLDAPRVLETFEDYSARYGALSEEFAKVSGGINPKSSKQMRELIYTKLGFAEITDFRGRPERTKAGQQKADKHTLGKLKAETPEQREFLKVAKELVKLKTPLQNLTKMQEIVKENPDDPRVFASFNQTVTKTDRLSSSARRGGFQFQNLDRAFKRLFRPRRSDSVICEGDGAQLEFRVAAYLGNDPAAKDDILRGVDVHAITASTLGVDRQSAKSRTFRPLYGGRSGTPRELKYNEYFISRYSSIYRTQSSWTMVVARDKLLVTPWGYRFYWPEAEISNRGYVTHTTEIFNYPIQQLATAEIIPLVLVLLWHSTAHLGDKVLLVNTIHDSIVAEVHKDAVDEYRDLLVRAFTVDIYPMLKKIYDMDFDVPLGCGFKAGEFWGAGEEMKFEPVR